MKKLHIYPAGRRLLGQGASGSPARDLAALRQGGIRIAYTRRPEIARYYLQHPQLERPFTSPYETTNWTLIEAIGQLSVAKKNERAFAAASFALRQKRLILAEEHPEWSIAAVEKAARAVVFGITEEAV